MRSQSKKRKKSSSRKGSSPRRESVSNSTWPRQFKRKVRREMLRSSTHQLLLTLKPTATSNQTTSTTRSNSRKQMFERTRTSSSKARRRLRSSASLLREICARATDRWKRYNFRTIINHNFEMGFLRKGKLNKWIKKRKVWRFTLCKVC